MFALQLQVDPFDIDFEITRKQDLELEKPNKPKKKKPADDGSTPFGPTVNDEATDEVASDDEDDLDAQDDELDEEEEQLE